MKKIVEGTASNLDMFAAVDADGGGSTSKEEFTLFSKRLGMSLS